MSLPVKVPHGNGNGGKLGILYTDWCLSSARHQIAALQSVQGTSVFLFRVHLGHDACVIISNRQTHGEYAGESDRNCCQCDSSFHRCLFSFISFPLNAGLGSKTYHVSENFFGSRMAGLLDRP
jgi:hypothetical protein